MAKRNKKDLDWEDDSGMDGMTPPEDKEFQVYLRDFVVPDKVQAFIEAYVPADELDADAEMLDDGRLREVFKAYVCALGDPLKLYLQDLKKAGFQMRISMATGEPAIFVKPKWH